MRNHEDAKPKNILVLAVPQVVTNMEKGYSPTSQTFKVLTVMINEPFNNRYHVSKGHSLDGIEVVPPHHQCVPGCSLKGLTIGSNEFYKVPQAMAVDYMSWDVCIIYNQVQELMHSCYDLGLRK